MRSHMLRRLSTFLVWSAFLPAVLLSITSCVLSAQSLNIVSGNGQVLFENFPSQEPLVVQALDASGNPISGATVNFTQTQGQGAVLTPTATTDSKGMASTLVVSTHLQTFSSFASETINATSPQGSVNFAYTTISSTGPTGPAQPGTTLLAPASDPPTITGASGAILPAAIQIFLSAGSGAEQGQPLPNVGIQLAPFDTSQLPGMCNGPGGVALSNAKGVATCDLMITAPPGTYEFQVSIGNLFLYRVFTIIVTPGSSCTYSLSASSQTIASGAASGSVNVLTTAGCSWTASSNASWISVSSGSTGTGGGPVGFAVQANTTGASRTGTLAIAGQTFTITQSASSTAGVSITTGATLAPATQNSPYSTMLSATGGTPPYTWTS